METFANGIFSFFPAFCLLAAIVGFIAFRSPNIDQTGEGSSVWLPVVVCISLSIVPIVNYFHDFCRRQSSSFGRAHPVTTWIAFIPNIFLVLLWDSIELKIHYAICCGQIVFISNIILTMGFSTSMSALVSTCANSLVLPLSLCLPAWFPSSSPFVLALGGLCITIGMWMCVWGDKIKIYGLFTIDTSGINWAPVGVYFLLISSLWAVLVVHRTQALHLITASEISALCYLQAIPIVASPFLRSDGIQAKDHLDENKVLKKRSDLVRFLSHELRSYLSHVSFGLHELADTLPEWSPPDITIADPDHKVIKTNSLKLLGELQESCAMIAQVLDDVAVFNRLRTDAQSGPPVLRNVVTIKTVLASVVAAVSPMMKKCRIDVAMAMDLTNAVTTKFSGLKLHVRGDEATKALRVVLESVLKASPQGEAVLVKGRIVGSDKRPSSSQMPAAECDQLDAPPQSPSPSPLPVGAGAAPTSATATKSITASIVVGAEVPLRCGHGDGTSSEVQTVFVGLLRLEVEGKGRGMSQETIASLLGESEDTFPLLGGQTSGLGLSIARILLERNGGRLDVHSGGPGTVCTFIIELPVYCPCGDAMSSCEDTHTTHAIPPLHSGQTTATQRPTPAPAPRCSEGIGIDGKRSIVRTDEMGQQFPRQQEFDIEGQQDRQYLAADVNEAAAIAAAVEHVASQCSQGGLQTNDWFTNNVSLLQRSTHTNHTMPASFATIDSNRTATSFIRASFDRVFTSRRRVAPLGARSNEKSPALVTTRSSSTISERMVAAVDAVKRSLQADCSRMHVVDDITGRLEAVMADVVGMREQQQGSSKNSRAVVEYCLRSRFIVNVPPTIQAESLDVKADHYFIAPSKPADRTVAIMCAPILRSDGVCMGVVELAGKAAGRRFDSGDEGALLVLVKSLEALVDEQRQCLRFEKTIAHTDLDHLCATTAATPIEGEHEGEEHAAVAFMPVQRVLRFLIVNDAIADLPSLIPSLGGRLHVDAVGSEPEAVVAQALKAATDLVPYDVVFVSDALPMSSPNSGLESVGVRAARDLIASGFRDRIVGCTDSVDSDFALVQELDDEYLRVCLDRAVSMGEGEGEEGKGCEDRARGDEATNHLLDESTKGEGLESFAVTTRPHRDSSALIPAPGPAAGGTMSSSTVQLPENRSTSTIMMRAGESATTPSVAARQDNGVKATAAAAATAATTASATTMGGGAPATRDRIGVAVKRCLVVDDVQSNRKIVRRLLEKLKHVVEEAEDGVEALQAFHIARYLGQPFDIVFMDNVMPNLDGPGAARKLREQSFRGPIIGVTGNVLQPDVELYLNHGADTVLGKPLRPDVVREIMSERYFQSLESSRVVNCSR